MIRKIKLDLKPLLKKLEVFSRKNVRGEFSGEYRSVYKGTGLEFEGYRDYTQADDALKIDWRASKRAGKLLVRELVEERNLNALFLFDVSNSMLFASVEKLKCEYGAEVVASLAFPMVQAGDSISLMMFSDNIVKFVPPASGKKQYFNMISALSDPKVYGGGYSFVKAIKRASATLKKDSFLFILSDFLGLDDEWKKYLKIACQKFDVMCIIIKDPLDLELPTEVGQVVLEDPFSSRRILVDPNTMGDIYKRNSLKRLNELTDAVTKAGADFIVLNTGKSYTEPMIEIFEKRKVLWR